MKSRAVRLGARSEKLHFAGSTSGNDIAKTIEGGEYSLVIVDSIQTLAMAEVASAPGTVSQVTNCGNLMIRAAKGSGTAVIIVGHVTKEGTLAGPKVLEHMVDVVLQFEGDSLRGDKFMELARRYTDFTELTAPLLHEFVEKVVVHESDKSSGRRVQQVDIYLNFIGKFDMPMEPREPSPEEIAEMEKLQKRRARSRANNRRFIEKRQREMAAAGNQHYSDANSISATN